MAKQLTLTTDKAKIRAIFVEHSLSVKKVLRNSPRVSYQNTFKKNHAVLDRRLDKLSYVL